MSPDVVTVQELARAANVPVSEVERFLARSSVRRIAGQYISWADAVEIGRTVKAPCPLHETATRTSPRPLSRGEATIARDASVASATAPRGPLGPAPLFASPSLSPRPAALPAAASGAAHGLAALLAMLLTSAGAGTTLAARIVPADPDPLRLVFLAIPGPGGGGGGGGARQATPPPKALKRGASRQSSPVPEIELPKPIEAAPEPEDVARPVHEEPPIVAPVARNPADDRDRPGIIEETPADTNSHGPGAGGGVGSGAGTGLGEGDGPGIGPGSGGGTGGGPYRPGSGIDPPRLLREVRADYTEEARRAGIQGDVLLEIVVRQDGTVGDVRVLQGLGYGLERRATDAVRQWRFTPARRRGSPVDVLVEVSVEFRLR